MNFRLYFDVREQMDVLQTNKENVSTDTGKTGHRSYINTSTTDAILTLIRAHRAQDDVASRTIVIHRRQQHATGGVSDIVFLTIDKLLLSSRKVGSKEVNFHIALLERPVEQSTILAVKERFPSLVKLIIYANCQ